MAISRQVLNWRTIARALISGAEITTHDGRSKRRDPRDHQTSSNAAEMNYLQLVLENCAVAVILYFVGVCFNETGHQ